MQGEGQAPIMKSCVLLTMGTTLLRTLAKVVPDVVQAQPHRHSHVPQVHPDERTADVQPRMGPDVLHRRRALERLPRGGGEGAAGRGLRADADGLIAVPLRAGGLQDQGAV